MVVGPFFVNHAAYCVQLAPVAALHTKSGLI